VLAPSHPTRGYRIDQIDTFNRLIRDPAGLPPAPPRGR
jgi:hypothetical protein